ncbi:MAG: cysteine desulfurase-like protein [Woeseia sp.]
MTAPFENGAAPVRGIDFPIEAIRAQFPALKHARNFAFFDNAAGAQVPQLVLDAVNHHLIEHNVQRGGRYAQSMAVDETIARARASVGRFVNARRAEEISFGMNATSFIRLVSLGIGEIMDERSEIVVTDLDHEANIATWLALGKQGVQFRWWNVRADGNLHVDDLKSLLNSNTRLVACTLASNALGSIVDVRAAADLAHQAGAEIFLDAVHYAPHGRMDVRAFDCDYLVCSGYKIFAPHMGFLWGRYELLQRLPTFREDFIPNEPPAKIEAGTVIYENLAGMDAAVAYLSDLGVSLLQQAGMPYGAASEDPISNAMLAIRTYEQSLSAELLHVLNECGAQVYGVDDPAQLSRRVPTVCFNLPGFAPPAVTEHMARAGVGIRDGHLYAPRLMARLGLDSESGAARVSLVHYNTMAEVHRFGNLLLDLRAIRLR